MQNIKKYFMTLALLLTAVGGAWAQSSLNVVEIEAPANWEGDNNPLTAAELTGFKASTLEEARAWKGAPTEGMAMLFYAFDGNDAYCVYFNNGEPISDSHSPFEKNILFGYSKLINLYYTAEPTEWSLTPDETGKSWTLAKMPASDIELQVEYFAESNLFLSKDALADKANIAVTAGETTVEFGDDGKSANTITEGSAMTVKFNGTKKVLGMKVAKKAPALLSIQIDGHVTATIYYFEGETWEQAIKNHPTENSAWKIDNGNISGNGANLFAGGNYEKVNPNSTIDPKAEYHLMWT